MTQITIIDFAFQDSLPKQLHNFTKGIVPHLNGIGEPVSAIHVICVEWEGELCTSPKPTRTFCVAIFALVTASN